jgi:Family of unknown function (DUF5675)
MDLKLIRNIYTDESTIGILLVNGKHQCYTLEDTDRKLEIAGNKKIYGETAIPRGKYEVVINYSNRFLKRLPLLLRVPQFEGIRFHAGNTADDTHGCILVGQLKGIDSIHKSKEAMDELMAILTKAARTEKITIEII